MSLVDKKCNYISILILFGAFLIFRPSPTKLLGPSLGLKVADAILLVFTIILMLKDDRIALPKNKSFFLLGTILLVELIGLGKSLMLDTIIFEDVFEIFRPVLYIFVYLGVYKVASDGVFDTQYLKKISKIIIFFLFVSYAQLFNLFNIKDYMGYIYELGKSRTMDINDSIWRVSGTFTNPNYFGFFLVFLACFMFSLFLIKNKKVKYGVAFVLTSALVLFTGSRTALVSEILSISVVLFSYYCSLVKKKKLTKLLKSSFLIIIFFVVIFYLVSPLIYDKFARFSNIENIKWNFLARYDAWKYALEMWAKNPILGNGPYKAYMDSFDNNYVLVLFRNGILGFIPFIALFLGSWRKSYSIFVRATDNNIRGYGLAMIGVTIAIMISMLAAVTYNFIQTGTIYIMLLAIQDKLINGGGENGGTES